MATLKQSAKGTYRVRFRYMDKQFFRSCETAEEKAANQVLARVEETISLLKTGRLTLPPDVTGEGVGDFIVSGGKVTGKPVIKETHTLKQTVADYFASIPTGAKSANSLATERTHLDHFVRILKPSTPIDSIGVGELQAYVTKRSKEKGIRGRKVQPETLRKELVTFGTMRRWAKAKGWCDGDLDRKALKLPKGAEKAPFRTWAEIESIVEKGGLTEEEQRDLWDCLFLSEKEVGDFLDFVAENGKVPWLHPALAIAAHTGARRSEIMRSELRDFDFDRGIATLREKKRVHSKSLSYRTVEIHPRLCEILKAWVAKHPGGKYTVCLTSNVRLAPDEALRMFEQTVAGSKWKKLRGWHVLRHSFASICAMKGVRESTIDSWMGHQTEAMRHRYRHLFPDVRKAEMGRVFSP
jgi:integrase